MQYPATPAQTFVIKIYHSLFCTFPSSAKIEKQCSIHYALQVYTAMNTFSLVQLAPDTDSRFTIIGLALLAHARRSATIYLSLSSVDHMDQLRLSMHVAHR